MKRISKQEFEKDVTRAQKIASSLGSVEISDRGKATHVLLSRVEFRRLCAKSTKLGRDLQGLNTTHLDEPNCRFPSISL